MREWIAKIIEGVGYASALAAAGFWLHFIWSFDWGRFGSRSWGVWFFFAFFVGTMLVACAVGIFFDWIAKLFR